MNVNKLVNKWRGGRKCRSLPLLNSLLTISIIPATSNAAATNYTWDGGAGPANDKWSQCQNWGVPDPNNVAPPVNSVAGLTNSDIFFAGNIRLIPKVDFWTIARTSSGVSFGAGESEATVFQLLLGGFANTLDGGTFSIVLGNAGKDLDLAFTPAAVPEPSPLSLFAFGFGLLCVIQRSRSRR